MSYNTVFKTMQAHGTMQKRTASHPFFFFTSGERSAPTAAMEPAKTRKKRIPRRLLASIPVDETVCRILDLPPELRTKIYEYVLAPAGRRITITKFSLAQPDLLRTCKTIRSEACSIYYHDTKFHIDVKDFDSTLLEVFCQQTGKYQQKASVEFKIMRGSNNWANLVAWLKAYFERKAVGFRCNLECGNYPCCTASMAFDMVEQVRDDMAWEKVFSLLELYKKASQQKRRWT